MASRNDRRQAGRRARPGTAVSRRQQRLDHADQGAHRHALHGNPHADRHQGLRQGPGRTRTSRQGDRGRGEDGARNHQRLRRAPDRRLLPDDRTKARHARALRPVDRRPAGRDRQRTGRRNGHDHGGGPRALRRDRALPARTARRPRCHRPPRHGAHDERRDGAARAARDRARGTRTSRHSAPRTRCSRPTSTSTSGIATSAATWPKRSAP